MMKIREFYYFLLKFFLLFDYSINYIVIPFNIEKQQHKMLLNECKSDNDIDFFIKNDKLFTLMSLGSDTIELYLDMNFFNFFLGKGLCRNNSLSTYEISNSKYFETLREDIERVVYIKNVSLCRDKCSLYSDIQLNNNITLKNNSFLYGLNSYSKNKFNTKQVCGYIGLQIEYNDLSVKECNFIKSLKQNKIISSYSWSILFFDKFMNKNILNQNILNKYDGFLLCGLEEKDYENIYFTHDIRTIQAKPRYSLLDWGIVFSEIFFEKNNEKFNYQSRVQIVFDINLEYIISTDHFFKNLKKTIFEKYFKQNICSVNTNNEIYYTIICNKTFGQYINSFPSLYFYHRELNYTFILSNKDLFKYYNNKIYFLIIHKTYNDYYWTLGNLFLKKYNFVFDYDKKLISFINIDNNKNKDIINKFNGIKSFFYKIKNISIIIGIIIGLIIGKKIWDKNRKKRANELIDNYQYESYFYEKENKEKNFELNYKYALENN